MDDVFGAPTVVLDVEALESGEVVALAQAGLARFDGGKWVRLPTPPIGGTHIRRGPGRVVHLCCDQHRRARSTNGGESWTVVQESPRFEMLHVLPPELVVGAGDARIGAVPPTSGGTSLGGILFLDDPIENNVIVGVAAIADTFVVAERFGRAARSKDLNGPWTASATRLGAEPEIVAGPRSRYFARDSEGEVSVSCDWGASFTRVGASRRFAEVASATTQLAFAHLDRAYAPSVGGLDVSCDLGQTWSPASLDEDITYDVSVGFDDTVWVAGPKRVHHLR